MHVRLLGDADDVTGFALAGVAGEECHNREEALAALDKARHDPDVSILVLSPVVAALVEDVVEPMRDATRLPITIVLPGVPACDPTSAAEATS